MSYGRQCACLVRGAGVMCLEKVDLLISIMNIDGLTNFLWDMSLVASETSNVWIRKVPLHQRSLVAKSL